MSFTRQSFAIAAVAAAILVLYLYNLDGFGMFGPDEPRYAAIGRSMAQTGNVVTPELWGRPWFEKPPLLYWMIAAATTLGLSPDLCGRLPIALLSLCFLGLCFFWGKHHFNTNVALAFTALLATSVGWLAFSSVGATDLPLAVFFSVAVLLALSMLGSQPDTHKTSTVNLLGIGFCVGLGTLTKGLVPIALTLPFAWFLRDYWRKWWLAVAAFLVTALPWYVAVYVRNGYPFIEDFFVKHHLKRLYSDSLLHVQPPYYYLPVFLGAVFPWTPLLLLFFKKNQPWDRRRRFLLAIVLWGLLFFSLSRNKLPGYLLPLLPSLFLLLGTQFENVKNLALSRTWLLPCSILIALVPMSISVLTNSLSLGRINGSQITHIASWQVFYAAIPLLIVLLPKQFLPGLLMVLCMALEMMFLKTLAYPVIDSQVSARGLWRTISGVADQTCDGGTDRDWLYGLNYYRGSSYPSCDTGTYQYVLRSRGRKMPQVEPLKPSK